MIKTDNENRIEWVDILKGILIISVIVAHSTTSSDVDRFTRLFNMPVFFIVSGYLMRIGDSFEPLQWTKKKLVSLMVPYICWFVLCSAIDGVLSLRWLLYGIYGGRNTGGVYWFITVLFIGEMLVYVIEHKAGKKKLLCYGACYIAAIALSFLNVPALPWDIEVAPMAAALIGTGYNIRQKQNSSGELPTKTRWIILACGIAVVACTPLLLKYTTYDVGMKNGMYGSPVLFPVVTAGYAIVLATASMLIARVHVISAVMAYIGRISLVIMYLHRLVMNKIFVSAFGWGFSRPLFTVAAIVISAAVFEAADRFGITRILFLGKKPIKNIMKREANAEGKNLGI